MHADMNSALNSNPAVQSYEQFIGLFEDVSEADLAEGLALVRRFRNKQDSSPSEARLVSSTQVVVPGAVISAAEDSQDIEEISLPIVDEATDFLEVSDHWKENNYVDESNPASEVGDRIREEEESTPAALPMLASNDGGTLEINDDLPADVEPFALDPNFDYDSITCTPLFPVGSEQYNRLLEQSKAYEAIFAGKAVKDAN
jgi:hypothetical protein